MSMPCSILQLIHILVQGLPFSQWYHIMRVLLLLTMRERERERERGSSIVEERGRRERGIEREGN